MTPTDLGFLPARAELRLSIEGLATSYMAWLLGTPGDSNPVVSGQCAHPVSSRLWFLPLNFESEFAATCTVPRDTYLMLSPGFVECSEIEGNGSTRTELGACVREGFDTISAATVSVDGRTARDLRKYIVTTDLDILPAHNLLGDDPTPTLTRGYFLVLAPLERGTHVVRTFDAFNDGFEARFTYTIVVP